MSNKKKINILLVDDQPTNLAVLQALLADFDEVLVCAASGEAALLEMQEREFALVLLDVQMPGMGGMETAARMRSDARSPAVPIIFITASYGDEQGIEQAYAMGAVDYLTKPVNPVILRAKVAVFIDLYRKTAEIARHTQAIHLAALKSRDERIRLIMDNTRDYAFISTDPDGIVTEWAGGAESITGWFAAKACGQNGSIIFTPEDRAAGRPEQEMHIARARARGGPALACAARRHPLFRRRRHGAAARRRGSAARVCQDLSRCHGRAAGSRTARAVGGRAW